MDHPPRSSTNDALSLSKTDASTIKLGTRLLNDALRFRALKLDTKIAILRAQLNDLLAQRATAQEGLDAITYPVLTLPVEITSQIFKWTLAPGGVASTLTAEGKSLVLGHICQLWRQIALSTPELWNTINIAVGPALDSDLSRIHTFLSRSSSMALSISINADSRRSQLAFRAAVDALVPYSRAWKNLSIFGYIVWQNLQPLHAIQQLPHLESLTLIQLDAATDGMLGTLFQKAPLLRKAHLGGYGYQRLALPWSQLTSLHLTSCDKTLADVLGWTPNVVDLIIGTVTAAPPNLPPLPHLRSLIFADTSISYGWPTVFLQAEILSQLNAPLRMLKIGVHSLAPFTPRMPHSAFLEQLSIDIAVVSAAGLDSASIECLTSMPSLRTLKIAAHNYTPTAISFSFGTLITRMTDDTEFLPALESLTVALLEPPSSVQSPIDIVALSDMLSVRWSVGLRNFELRSRRPLPDLNSKVMGLRASGMCIRLQVSPDLDVNRRRAEF